MFTDGPPGTALEEDWLNAIQEEICNVIEDAGITLKTASTETRNQLLAAIQSFVGGGGIVDTTLSGTPKVFRIYDENDVPYYFKAYPTKV
jgi:hypothetical protein